jgi:hypothetical protein
MAVGVALVVAAPSARALTLADLDGGASFAAGPLLFSNFDVTAAGDVSLDLADYPVQILADGFRLSGPLAVLLGDAGTLLVSYTVSAVAPVIAGAALFAPAQTIGDGSQAWVADTLLDAANAPLGSLFAFDVEGYGASPFAGALFAPVSLVQVVKTVNLASGFFSALPLVDQRFLVVPEPLTLALLALGLGGLAAWGRRHEAHA